MNLIPMPTGITYKIGVVKLGAKSTVSGDFDKAQAKLKDALGGIAGGESASVKFCKSSALGEESYEISCNGGNVTVTASSDAGAFYAYATLRQLIEEDGTFDCVDIKDAPKYTYRGFMLDCSRHFWTKEKIKSYLDIMALLKMNVFHWHLTDDQGWRAEIKKYPLLTKKGTTRRTSQLFLKEFAPDAMPADEKYGEGMYYSQEDMREIVAYAAERHIEVVPEIDMPGHMVAAIACYPELSCAEEAAEVSCRYGVMENILCCGKDQVYQFAKDIIDELCEIFTGRFFHIGGDEVPKARWKTCPRCQKKMKELNLADENALQGYFTGEITNYLKSKGKRMIGWNEILESRNLTDKDIVAQWWWPRSIGNKNEKEWMKGGGQCLLSLCPYIYMDHSYSMRPLKKTYSFSEKKLASDGLNVLGMEIPQWVEFIADEEKLDMLTCARLVAFSEVCWLDAMQKNYKDFEFRLENLRGYFEKIGCKICPQKMYRGKVKPPYVLTAASKWLFWTKNHDYEYDRLKELRDSEK